MRREGGSWYDAQAQDEVKHWMEGPPAQSRRAGRLANQENAYLAALSEAHEHASRRVQHGIIAFVVGLLITGLTFADAEQGGSYVISYVILWGLPVWGVYAIVSGWSHKQELRRLMDEFAAGHRPRESVTQKAPPDWWSIRDVE